jgi:hypothetical protein
MDVANVSVRAPYSFRHLQLTVTLPAPREAGGERRQSVRFPKPLDRGAKVDVVGCPLPRHSPAAQ